MRTVALPCVRLVEARLLVAELGSDAVAARCQARVDAALGRYIAARGAMAEEPRRTA